MATCYSPAELPLLGSHFSLSLYVVPVGQVTFVSVAISVVLASSYWRSLSPTAFGSYCDHPIT